MNQVKAIQGDTLDAIAHRYFAEHAVAMLPALFEANPHCLEIFIDQHVVVYLPETIQKQKSQRLKLWD